MARVFSLQARASGSPMRRWIWSTPPSYTRYSAQLPGNSFTLDTSTNGTAPVAAKRLADHLLSAYLIPLVQQEVADVHQGLRDLGVLFAVDPPQHIQDLADGRLEHPLLFGKVEIHLPELLSA